MICFLKCNYGINQQHENKYTQSFAMYSFPYVQHIIEIINKNLKLYVGR